MFPNTIYHVNFVYTKANAPCCIAISNVVARFNIRNRVPPNIMVFFPDARKRYSVGPFKKILEYVPWLIRSGAIF